MGAGCSISSKELQGSSENEACEPGFMQKQQKPPTRPSWALVMSPSQDTWSLRGRQVALVLPAPGDKGDPKESRKGPQTVSA